MLNFSEHELLLRLNYGPEPHVLVDVGMHVGLFSKSFAQLGWQIIGFEPEPGNFREAQDNLKPFDHVTVLPQAVCEQSSSSNPFFLSNEHWAIHSLQPFHHTHKTQIDVKTTRLDEALNKLNIERVTLLKIDIEGADFLALKSFDFSKWQPNIVMCEFMDVRTKPYFNYNHHDMAQYMQRQDYVVYTSEWAPIQQYGKRNQESGGHRWIQCKPYCSTQEPAWGNLIGIRSGQADIFELTLETYLTDLQRQPVSGRLRSVIKLLPGTQQVYRILRSKVLR